jgi:prevent-host-death family protein
MIKLVATTGLIDCPSSGAEGVMVLEVGAFEAKTHLSRLLERVNQGDRVIITRRGVPVAVLVSPQELDRGNIADVASRLKELRERTRPLAGGLRGLKEDGRKR